MKFRLAVQLAVLLSLLTTSAAWAQYIGYNVSPTGISYGTSPSVLSLEIQAGYPRAIVRKNDFSAFQTTGTMRLYRDGVQIASATQYAGTASVTIPFSWGFTSGTRNFYAMTSTNPYASGSVSVTAGYIPAPPAGVTATPASSSSVAVSWNAVSGATRYKVRHTNTGQQTGDLYTTSYTYPGLAANTNHCFVVLACADAGFCSAPSVQVCATTPATQLEQYKVGVLMYRGKLVKDAAGKDVYQELTWPEIDAMLEAIKADIAGGRPARTGNGREARLVVQLDVEWDRTEPVRGQYDFSWFQEFARRCKLKQIKWTPLLSPHYVPAWALASYEPDRLRDMQGGIVADAGYLKFSPSSYVWGGEVSSWVRAFVDAMAYDGANNHFGANGVIDEMLLGNEMTYPFHVLTSKDSASQREWLNRVGGTFPSTFTTTFRTFRAEQLSYSINAMIQAARGRLDQVGASQVGVSSKLYPYYFPGRSGEGPNDQWRGYTDSSISFLDSNFRTFFAFDSYPSNYCGGSWSVTNDYNAVRSRSAKKLYVAEFNVNRGTCTNTVLTRAQVSNAVITGFQSYNVRAFTFLAWNPSGEAASRTITSEQKLGLADAMNWVVP